MQFITLAALAGAAIAAPAPQATSGGSEILRISNYTTITLNGKVTDIDFRLTGDNATNLLCVGAPIDPIPQPKPIKCEVSALTSTPPTTSTSFATQTKPAAMPYSSSTISDLRKFIFPIHLGPM